MNIFFLYMLLPIISLWRSLAPAVELINVYQLTFTSISKSKKDLQQCSYVQAKMASRLFSARLATSTCPFYFSSSPFEVRQLITFHLTAEVFQQLCTPQAMGRDTCQTFNNFLLQVHVSKSKPKEQFKAESRTITLSLLAFFYAAKPYSSVNNKALLNVITATHSSCYTRQTNPRGLLTASAHGDPARFRKATAIQKLSPRDGGFRTASHRNREAAQSLQMASAVEKLSAVSSTTRKQSLHVRIPVQLSLNLCKSIRGST